MNFSVQVKVMPLERITGSTGKSGDGWSSQSRFAIGKDVRIGKTIQLQVEAAIRGGGKTNCRRSQVKSFWLIR